MRKTSPSRPRQGGKARFKPSKVTILFTVISFVVLASAFTLVQIANNVLDMELAFDYIILQLVLWGVFFTLTLLFYQRDYLDEVELFFEIVALVATVISIAVACWDIFTLQNEFDLSLKEMFDFSFSGILLLDAIAVIVAKIMQIYRMLEAKKGRSAP